MNYTNRRLLLGVMVTMISLSCFAQLSTNAYYNGYWGEWRKQYFEYSGHTLYNIYGNYSGFIVYDSYSHPSEYVFKFQIDYYNPPTKETIKYHRKNDIWYEYSGSVEYFINNDWPTIKSALMSFNFPHVRNKNENIQKTARATIKIAPYKDHPRIYNIWFEDVAIAFDLGDGKFNL